MSVLSYSELLRRIANIDEQTLEKPYKILQRHTCTGNRLVVLRCLARQDRATIGQLLQKTGHNKGGGSYITIQRFFEALSTDGLLVSEKRGNRVYWKFAPEYHTIKEFMLA
ncbi:MAG: hypothetical protein ACQESG_03495 [Nanobdellota archaeon]